LCTGAGGEYGRDDSACAAAITFAWENGVLLGADWANVFPPKPALAPVSATSDEIPERKVRLPGSRLIVFIVHYLFVHQARFGFRRESRWANVKVQSRTAITPECRKIVEIIWRGRFVATFYREGRKPGTQGESFH
jgi:hypothetical protein